MDYIHELIHIVKRWFSYFGLTSQQNFEDIFYQLLHDKNYDEAVKLAQQHKYLDIDLVYKCKWRNSGITVPSINHVLAAVQDKLWAINECVQTVPMSYEACRTLIEFGLKNANLRLLYELGSEQTHGDSQRTSDKHEGKFRLGRDRGIEKQPLLSNDISDDEIEALIDFDSLNDQQKELCRCHQDLMRHEHSLFAYENILGDYRTVEQQFNHVFYSEFRQKSPLNVCIDYAHDGDAHAVEILLNFYTEDLAPHLLAILSNFPETTSPYQYRNLLPCLREGETTYEWRALSGTVKRQEFSWSCRGISKSPSCKSDFDIQAKEFEETFYKENVSLKKYLQPFTSDILSQWFLERALEMESRTLLLSCAIQLLHLGSELNIKDLSATHADLLEFARIIYDCCTEDNIYLSYEEYKKMPEIDRILLETGNSMYKKFNSNETKYELLGSALAKFDDPDGKLSVKILEHVIELRKRDEKIQLAYLQLNM